jgi:hypothetical protein
MEDYELAGKLPIVEIRIILGYGSNLHKDILEQSNDLEMWLLNNDRRVTKKGVRKYIESRIPKKTISNKLKVLSSKKGMYIRILAYDPDLFLHIWNLFRNN